MKILRKLTVLWTVLALLVALIITPNVSHAADSTVIMPEATVNQAYNATETVTLTGEIQGENTVVNWPNDGLNAVIENTSGNTWKFSVSGTPTVSGTRSVTYVTTTERKTFTLTVNPASGATKSVTLSGGANATASGSTSQTGLTGAMETVAYVANTGYHFEEFADRTSNGITVTRTSDTVVTVSGN